MDSMKVMSVVGARPNFMKVAPIDRRMAEFPQLTHIIVHTGQHYDREMSDVFFDQLGLPTPTRHLGVGSGRHGEMTGKIMIAFEEVCLDLQPDLVVVVGDVNSTIAASLVARKLFIPVAHVEAGLRSFDETMPEEHNRRLTDHLSNLLFVSEPAGEDNLRREGIEPTRVHLVGDIMLETLQTFLPIVEERKRWEHFGMDGEAYALVTLHRPSNVDTPEALNEIIDMLELIEFPIIFPMHPRTSARLDTFGLRNRLNSITGLHVVPPESYLDFLSLMQGAKLLVSDSGSVQAEASLFDVPCLICRLNTERPIYIEVGTSVLVGRDKELTATYLDLIRSGTFKCSGATIKTLGEKVSDKIVQIIANYLAGAA